MLELVCVLLRSMCWPLLACIDDCELDLELWLIPLAALFSRVGARGEGSFSKALAGTSLEETAKSARMLPSRVALSASMAWPFVEGGCMDDSCEWVSSVPVACAVECSGGSLPTQPVRVRGVV